PSCAPHHSPSRSLPDLRRSSRPRSSGWPSLPDDLKAARAEQPTVINRAARTEPGPDVPAVGPTLQGVAMAFVLPTVLEHEGTADGPGAEDLHLALEELHVVVGRF